LLQQSFWFQQQKKLFVVPNFVAVTKPFFSVQRELPTLLAQPTEGTILATVTLLAF